MELHLRTKLKLRDDPDARALVELLAIEFPGALMRTAAGGGVFRVDVEIHSPVTESRKLVFLDIMRAIDPLLVETVYLQGRLGDHYMTGYLGPEKEAKEKSRSRLETITEQIRQLLPEHRNALRALLADG
jgi:hypothetical protein